MRQEAAGGEVEHFRPTSGRVTGVLALVLTGAIVLVALLDGGTGLSAPVVAGAVLAGVLAWAAILRPALWVAGGELVMRNMLETVHIPLAAIEQIALRQVLAVCAGDRRYVSAVVGRSLRQTLKSSGPTTAAVVDRRVTDMPYADFVEERLRQLVDDARTSAGVRRGSEEQLALAHGVRRQPAWLPIGLVAAAAVWLVLTLVL